MKYYIATHEDVNTGNVAPVEIFKSTEVDHITRGEDLQPIIHFVKPGKEPMPCYNIAIVTASALEYKYSDEHDDIPGIENDDKYRAPEPDDEDLTPEFNNTDE